jgi:hypothetical protein
MGLGYISSIHDGLFLVRMMKVVLRLITRRPSVTDTRVFVPPSILLPGDS